MSTVAAMLGQSDSVTVSPQIHYVQCSTFINVVLGSFAAPKPERQCPLTVNVYNSNALNNIQRKRNCIGP